MNNGPAQNSIYSQLMDIPLDARMTYEVHATEHLMIPVGIICSDAAAELQMLTRKIAQLSTIAKEQHELILLGSAELQKFAEEAGGCDHPVGICCCSLYALIDRMGDIEAQYNSFD